MKDKEVKIVLDLTLMNKHDILLEEMLCLIAIKYPHLQEHINADLFDILVEKELLKFEMYKPIITNKGNLFISLSTTSSEDEVIVKKRGRVVKEENNIIFSEGFIERYRNKFKNLKPGSMGDPKAVVIKMTRFFKEYKNANENDILRAVERYLKTLENYAYLQRADYFIYKLDKKEEMSRLAIFLEEVQNGNSEDPDGWLTNLA